MRFFEVDSAVDAIMSAAMLAQTKAGSRDMQLFNTLLGGGADFGQLYYRFGQLDDTPTKP